MFDSLRERLSKVQDEITSSFRGLTVGEPVAPAPGTPDLNAGADLLAKYQRQWEDIHSESESNARLAKKLDAEIQRMYSHVIHRREMFASLEKEFASLNQVLTSTETIVNQLGELRSLVDTVERDLVMFEDFLEEQEAQKQKDAANENLNLYKREKLLELDLVKDALNSIHTEKLKAKEDMLDMEMQAKHELYDRKSKIDLELYKTMGLVPPSDGLPEDDHSDRLAEIVIEDGQDDLETLLKDVILDDPAPQPREDDT